MKYFKLKQFLNHAFEQKDIFDVVVIAFFFLLKSAVFKLFSNKSLFAIVFQLSFILLSQSKSSIKKLKISRKILLFFDKKESAAFISIVLENIAITKKSEKNLADLVLF